MNKQKLLNLIRSNPNSGFKKLYRYYPAIQKYILKNSGSKLDAQDIFQESLLLFYSKINEKDFVLTSQLETYLFGISKFLWQNELRKKSSLVNSIKLESEPKSRENNDIQELLLKEEKIAKIENVLLNIGEKCKSILELFYRKSKSMLEISKALGFKSVQSAKTQKYKCVERVRKEIMNLKQSI